eukprot:6198290-Pleurochrysis_carterae.AAC.1
MRLAADFTSAPRLFPGPKSCVRAGESQLRTHAAQRALDLLDLRFRLRRRVGTEARAAVQHHAHDTLREAHRVLRRHEAAGRVRKQKHLLDAESLAQRLEHNRATANVC